MSLKQIKSTMPKLEAKGLAPMQEAIPAYGQGRGGRPWRRLRDAVLKRDRYLCQCQQCKADKRVTLAEEVDHIIPISEGGTDDMKNLQAINAQCHKVKTAKEAARGAARNRGG